MLNLLGLERGSDKPGEPEKPGDMINILKSWRKFQKFFKSWRSQGGFFDKADKPIFRLFLLKLKSKMCVLCFLHDRLFIFDLFFNILIIGVLIVNCVLYLFLFFSEHNCFQGCIAY